MEQYNDRENRFGLPAERADGKIEKERPFIIFRKTLDKEKEGLFGINKQGANQDEGLVSAFLTNKNEQGDKTPMKRINEEEQERDDSPPMREFTLHKFSLKQL